MSSTAA